MTNVFAHEDVDNCIIVREFRVQQKIASVWLNTLVPRLEFGSTENRSFHCQSPTQGGVFWIQLAGGLSGIGTFTDDDRIKMEYANGNQRIIVVLDHKLKLIGWAKQRRHQGICSFCGS